MRFYSPPSPADARRVKRGGILRLGPAVWLAASCFATDARAASAPSSTIRGIEVDAPTPTEARVRILGVRTPDFSVVEATDPFRIVVQVADCDARPRVDGPASPSSFVRLVAVAAVPLEEGHNARVVLELADAASFRVRAEGETIELRIAVPRGWRPPAAAPTATVPVPAPARAPPLVPEIELGGGPLTEPFVDVPQQPPRVSLGGTQSLRLVDSAGVRSAASRSLGPGGAAASVAPARGVGTALPPPVAALAPLPDAFVRAPLPAGLPPAGPLREAAAQIPGVGASVLPVALLRADRALAKAARGSAPRKAVLTDSLRNPNRPAPRAGLAELVARAEAPPEPVVLARAEEAPLPTHEPPPGGGRAPAVSGRSRAQGSGLVQGPRGEEPGLVQASAAPVQAPMSDGAAPVRVPSDETAAPVRTEASVLASRPPAAASMEGAGGQRGVGPNRGESSKKGEPQRLLRFPGAAATPKTSPRETISTFRPPAERRETVSSFQPPPAPRGGAEAPSDLPVTALAAQPSGAQDGRPGVLNYIGFQQVAGTSRVFVRLDRQVGFRSRESPSEDTFVLELVNTRITVENNTRPLDTSFFPGPVTLVQAKRIGRNVHVEVRLRAAAEWKIKRIGTTVAVDFRAAN